MKARSILLRVGNPSKIRMSRKITRIVIPKFMRVASPFRPPEKRTEEWPGAPESRESE